MPRGTVYPTHIRSEARELRHLGLSLGEISCKMALPKNTISGWVQDAELSQEQKLRLKTKEIISIYKARKLATKACKKKASDKRSKILTESTKYSKLPYHDENIGRIVCAILYLCEGSKHPATDFVSFGNSDPGLIKLFLRLLRNNFDIDESKFRCRVMHRADQNPYELMAFWSEATNIPLTKFYRSYFDKRTKNKPTQKLGYKGVCAVYYLNSLLQYRLQSIGEEIIKMVELRGIEPLTYTMPLCRASNCATAPCDEKL